MVNLPEIHALDPRYCQCNSCQRVCETKHLVSLLENDDPRLKGREDTACGQCPFCTKGVAFYLSDPANHQVAEGVRIAQMMANAANGSSNNLMAHGMVLAMQTEHRTIQQGFGRMILTIMGGFAKMDKDGLKDARNKDWLELCTKVMQIDGGYPPGLPYI